MLVGAGALARQAAARQAGRTLRKAGVMFLIIAVILALAWILGISVFHVAGGLIHLLLIVALISLIWHFVSGRRTPVV
jgi:hypothetical protein